MHMRGVIDTICNFIEHQSKKMTRSDVDIELLQFEAPAHLNSLVAKRLRNFHAEETNGNWLSSYKVEVGQINNFFCFCIGRDLFHGPQAVFESRSDQGLVMCIENERLAVLRRKIIPAPFWEPTVPMQEASFVELRIYRYRNESIPLLRERWGALIDARRAHSPLLLCGHTEGDAVTEWISFWGYRDLNERQAIRSDVIKKQIWPPGVFSGLVSQRNSILVPV
jgi:hypothetical protein